VTEREKVREGKRDEKGKEVRKKKRQMIKY
jgi:hypothetical protein